MQISQKDRLFLEIALFSTVDCNKGAWYDEAWVGRIKPILRVMLRDYERQERIVDLQQEELLRLTDLAEEAIQLCTEVKKDIATFKQEVTNGEEGKT